MTGAIVAKNEGLQIHRMAWPRKRVSTQNQEQMEGSDEVLLNSIFLRSFRIYWLRNIQLEGAGECHCTFRPAHPSIANHGATNDRGGSDFSYHVSRTQWRKVADQPACTQRNPFDEER